jgi:hypothetical protein
MNYPDSLPCPENVTLRYRCGNEDCDNFGCEWDVDGVSDMGTFEPAGPCADFYDRCPACFEEGEVVSDVTESEVKREALSRHRINVYCRKVNKHVFAKKQAGEDIDDILFPTVLVMNSYRRQAGDTYRVLKSVEWLPALGNRCPSCGERKEDGHSGDCAIRCEIAVVDAEYLMGIGVIPEWEKLPILDYIRWWRRTIEDDKLEER